MNRKVAALVSSILVISSCTTAEYFPPEKADRSTTSLIVPATKNVVWSRLISKLSKNFFVIDTIDKESGYLNITFSGEPGGFVYCGYSHVKHGADESNKIAGTVDSSGYNYYVKESMRGKINLVVTETSAQSTEVSVNIRFILHEDAVLPGNAYKSQTDGMVDTNKFGSFGVLTCVSTGRLEGQILDLAK